MGGQTRSLRSRASPRHPSPLWPTACCLVDLRLHRLSLAGTGAQVGVESKYEAAGDPMSNHSSTRITIKTWFAVAELALAIAAAWLNIWLLAGAMMASVAASLLDIAQIRTGGNQLRSLYHVSQAVSLALLALFLWWIVQNPAA